MVRQIAFVGTYTSGASDGLYTCDITPDEAPTLRRSESSELADNPSFLTLHPTCRRLYAVHEVEAGSVTAIAIDDEGRGLRRLNRVDSGASGPCHSSVHPSGDFLFVAHYTGAAVSVIPIWRDGTLAPTSDIVSHEGSSADPERQAGAHPHSVIPGPDGRFLYVPDLGTDEIVVYELDERNGAIERAGAFGAEPGAGPRHLEFHPNGRYGYVINELDSTLTALERDPETGSLSEIATRSTLPPSFDGENATADVHVHPSGRWVYGSNRGHDSIAIFEINNETGAITPAGHESTRGEWPRHFAIDDTGAFLFAENRASDTIVVFRIDEGTGALAATGETISIPEPVCMRVRPLGS
ncbi:lactonase family protein [Halosolutus gelatinilyticus]|uniref:lactonase family protein n=1 Tax=Halosolutus gelatinilyticus TaxID=2931975 RepID=UPI001FF3986B|nr:lactonase family protein [Halosolutus gelatinilyticus]